jgi:hypothetical protein
MLAGLLAACDPAEVVYLEHPGGEPLLCPGGETTRYEVVHAVTDPDDRNKILYEERGHFTVDPAGGALSTDPDRVSAGLIAGSLETGRVPWIQFTVTCGEAEAPLLTTRKITRDDLKRVDGDYLYVVE